MQKAAPPPAFERDDQEGVSIAKSCSQKCGPSQHYNLSTCKNREHTYKRIREEDLLPAKTQDVGGEEGAAEEEEDESEDDDDDEEEEDDC